jgi:hypothetical protein
MVKTFKTSPESKFRIFQFDNSTLSLTASNPFKNVFDKLFNDGKGGKHSLFWHKKELRCEQTIHSFTLLFGLIGGWYKY